MLNTAILLPLVLVLTLCHAFPNGPPLSVCHTALPVHNDDGKRILPQTTETPYRITVNATSVRAGDTLKVRVESKPDTDEWFRGLFLQALEVPNFEGEAFVNNPIGNYNRLKMNTKLITCHVSMDTLTHKDGFVKKYAEFEWTAPLLLKRDVIIRATVLTNFSTYWMGVKSPLIALVDKGPLPVEALERPWLREIIKNIRMRGNRQGMEAATVARFEKGFRGAMDPSGYIMVHYITQLMPFENKFNGTSYLDHTNMDASINSTVAHGTVTIPRYKTLERALLKGDYSVINELEAWLDETEH